jgi:lysine decarboxylase
VTQLSPAPAILDPRDPLALAADAPLLRAWLGARLAVEQGRFTPFTVPGHKQRRDLLGEVVAGDLPLYGALAPIKTADALLAEAERRAAGQFGADWCRFSVGGSTHGNQALALAVARPGQKVIVARTLHRSMLLALVMADLVPVWVRPRLHPGTAVPLGIEAAAVREALAAHPDARAVLLTDPSYVGTCGDVPAIADAAHAAGVPLVLDAAWGAHFGTHPALPPLPLSLGADAVVTSAHKTLPAMNQAALVLARTRAGGGLLDADRLTRAFEAGHTTSPSGTVLASLDAARALLAARGADLAEALLRTVGRARRRLAAVPGLTVLDSSIEGLTRLDPSKLVVQLAGTGAHGHAVEADLIAAGMPPEMADRDTVIPMVTLADDDETVDALVRTLIGSVERHRGPNRVATVHPAWNVQADQVISPREAFFAEHETVPWDRAAGRVCAEVLAPYPPGVPVLAPGELITAEALEALAVTRADGGRVAYAADPTLASVQVVRAR